MKLRQLFPFAFLALTAVSIFVGCKNDDDETPDGKAQLELQFDFTVDGQAFVANEVYTINGTAEC